MSVPAKINQSLFASLQGIEVPKEEAPAIVASSSACFVGFVNPKSEERYAEILQDIPGAGRNTAYYKDAEGYKKLEPFRFYLFDHRLHWVKRDQAGELIAVQKADNPPKKFGELSENVEAVLIVQVGDKFVPVTCAFRGANSKMIAPATKELAACKTPAWGDKTPDHKVALGIPVPNFRFIVTAMPGTALSGKGVRYATGAALCRPASAADIKMLSESADDPLFASRLEQAKDFFAKRVSELDAKV